MVAVSISPDKGRTWTGVEGRGVLVIVPGAGVHTNAKAYKHLETSYTVHYRDTFSREGGFKYPNNWTDIATVSLAGHSANSLVGLTSLVGSEIQNGTLAPSVIICGSRGGQVVLPLLMRFFWRGPFVCINAGLLTSQSSIPSQATPFFVTCAMDYFCTSNPRTVASRFASLSDTGGTNLFLKNADHMPDLQSRASKCLLKKICDYLLSGARMGQWTMAPYIEFRLSDPSRSCEVNGGGAIEIGGVSDHVTGSKRAREE